MDIKLPIPTYVVNIASRTDRLEHIIEQFKERKYFDLRIVTAIEDENGAVGLWKSFVKVIKMAQDSNLERIVFCEDDHMFTCHHSYDYLIRNMKEAIEKNIELLIGGVSGFGLPVPIGESMYWTDWYWGNQFLVINNTLFQRILDYKFKDHDVMDDVLSCLCSAKAIIYPFISEQKEFGYSDINEINGREGYVSKLFNNTRRSLSTAHRINMHYNNYRKKE